MDTIFADLRVGARRLRRDVLLTSTAVVSLAIGIGANTAVYTVTRALLFNAPPGVEAPDRLVDIGRTDAGYGFNPLSYRDYLDLRARTTTLQAAYAYNMFPQAVALRRDDGPPDRLFATFVSSTYFQTLGVVAQMGRVLHTGDGEGPGAMPVVVLSDSAWARLFNRHADAIGRSLTLNGQIVTVVGIAAAGFHGSGVRSADAWLPIGALQTTDSIAMTASDASWLMVGGRLHPGTSISQADAEMAVIGRTLPSSPRAPTRGLRAVAASPVPGGQTQIEAFMALLIAIVAAVLAVACANVAGMLLSRAPERHREMAVRTAIGATRARLVRQLLLETMVLFLVSAAAGVFVARAMTRAVLAFAPALPFRVDLSLPIDVRAIAFTTAVALLAAIMSGLLPAWQGARVELSSAGVTDRPSRMRTRRVFVVSQVALSLVLAIVGSLFVRALTHAGVLDPGFDARGIDLVTVDLGQRGDVGPDAALTLDAVVARVRAIPGVAQASAAFAFPGGFEEFRLASLRVPSGDADLSGEWNIVTPDFFSTIRMRLVAGRAFSENDRAGAPSVVVLGEGAVKRLWPNTRADAAVGRVIEERRFDPVRRTTNTALLTVAGVVRDPAYGTLIDGATDVHVYVPFAQQSMPRMMIVARSTDGRSVGTDVRAVIASMHNDVSVVTTQSAEEYSSLGLMPQRIGASLTAGLGIIGLLLTGIGIYGVTAHAVARRTREIGIRIAVGATTRAIARLIVGEGMLLIAAGVAIGLVLSVGAAQVVSGYLAGLPPLDPLAFGGAVIAFVAIGLTACSVPGRRAVSIAPTEALQE